jgi:hypothetical protein
MLRVFFFTRTHPLLSPGSTAALRLIVLEGRVLRVICGAERAEVMGDWRKVRNVELYDLYCSAGVIRVITLRRITWVGHVARMGEKRDAYKVLVGKP